ncbi:MAG: UDP-2,3-diacylglucosamine diphosphatase [Bacteroidia bacterium]|nr:UDP-2,3-diacylglucosamine diphosphatase [Bacteroidota bacterium]MBK8584549.1 UDP-2,3-diacylglucosamine diphosphatase [Bacteroidota bacterium]MBP9790289.1 UDP-2,3-diacylglucosamine diphosphatase [Bacteroidia bacterium]MBP9924222.1 UDP-2,3-diacylglucosamine diphosphatase [Bacteroidia bacterium]
MKTGKKIYFASDFHLGVPTYEKSLEREHRIVRWLDSIRNDAEELYLLGDVFDFWFEYKTVVPRGYVRLLGKLAELSDSGIKIHYFTGNHDMWTFDYLEKELNVTIYRAPIERVYNSKTFYIGHGDGLGPGDHGYKFIKKIFASKICQWLFARLHPNFGIGIANYFSKKSRIATGTTDEKFLGEEKEWLVIYSKEILAKKHFDYLIFGHRHLPLDIKINDSRYINLGDWIQYFTYGVFDGENFELKKG